MQSELEEKKKGLEENDIFIMRKTNYQERININIWEINYHSHTDQTHILLNWTVMNNMWLKHNSQTCG